MCVPFDRDGSLRCMNRQLAIFLYEYVGESGADIVTLERQRFARCAFVYQLVVACYVLLEIMTLTSLTPYTPM